MRAHLNHSELLITLSCILLFHQTPTILLWIPKDCEGKARGFQLEVDLAMVYLDEVEKLIWCFAMISKDYAPFMDRPR